MSINATSWADYLASTQRRSAGTQGQNQNRVGFFSKMSNGEKKFVRFNYSCPDDFKIYNVHTDKTLGKFGGLVACHRKGDMRLPTSACPVCAAGGKIERKAIVQMIEYVKGNDGKMVARPVTWVKPAGFFKELAALMDLNGDLRPVLFQITRTGEQLDTRYALAPVLVTASNMNIYNEENFPADFSAFDTFDPTGRDIHEYSVDDMQQGVLNGNFGTEPLTAIGLPVLGVPSSDDLPFDDTPTVGAPRTVKTY